MIYKKRLFYKTLALSLFLIFISINFVSAACYVNGKEVPCGEFFKNYGWIFLAIPVFLILWIIFVVKMIIDFYNKISGYPDVFDFKWMLKWIFGLSITGGLGFIVYYFAIYRKYKKEAPVRKVIYDKKSDEKEIISISANHFRKLNFPWNAVMNIFFLNFLNPYGYADGGKLTLRNSKLLFEPHILNMPGGKLEINLSDIKDLTDNPGATNKVRNIIIKTTAGEEKFVIWQSQAEKFLKELSL